MAVSVTAKRLRELRVRAGWGLRGFASELGMKPQGYEYYEQRFKKAALPISLVRSIYPHFIGRGTPPITADEIASLAGVKASAIAPAEEPPSLPLDLPASTRRPPALLEPAQTIPSARKEKDVPVWASAAAGDDGVMVLTAEPIDYISRSELMKDVKDPFAFYVVGDSMSDVIEHGDQVVINPSRLPQPGKDHVFVHEDGQGTMLALVKRLLKSTSTHWRVRQYNPPKDFDILKSKYPKALRITEKRYS